MDKTTHIQFVNYYEVLGLTPSATENEIGIAYREKVKKAGDESAKNLLFSAYEVLSSTYRYRPVYDEEYQKYIVSSDRANYVIEDEWLSNEIKNIRRPIPVIIPKKSIKTRIIGCLLNVFGFLFLLVLIGSIKTCSRKSIKQTLAVNELRSDLTANNEQYPQKIADGIYAEKFEMTPSAFQYQYRIDDAIYEDVLDRTTKQSLWDNLQRTYKPMYPMIKQLIIANLGIQYIFRNKSGTKEHIETFSVDDLKNLK